MACVALFLAEIAPMGMGDIRFDGIGDAPHTPQWKMRPHRHPMHEMIVVDTGRMFVRILDRVISAAAGDVLFYPRDVVHEEWTDANEPARTYWISFHWDAFDALPLVTHDVHGRVRLLTAWLYAERDAYFRHAAAVRQAFMQSILTELLSASERGEHELIDAVRCFVRDHIAEQITLDRLARHVKLSKYHFLRTYKHLTGRTPMQDVRMMRLQFARELILTTDLPLKTIAPRAGLTDEYHLSRLFRRCLNTSPGQFRRIVRR